MSNVSVDFEVHPAVAKCSVCNQEEIIPVPSEKLAQTAKLIETMEKIKEIERKHESCIH